MEKQKATEGQGRKRAVIYIMTFIMGGCGIAYEYTFSKIGSDLMGNSVRQWALTIGLMMFFMGIGSDLQKHLKDKGLFDKFILFEVLLGLIGGFGPLALLWTFGVWRDHYAILQYLLIILTGFLIGLEIPILARINERFTTELRVNIGGILRMDYIGAFFGAVLWAYVFISYFSLTRIGLVLGIFNLITAGLSLLYFSKLAERKMALSLLVIVSALAMIYGWTKAPEWSKHAEQRLFADKIIYSESTKYQHIVMTKSASNDIYCYINGNTQFSSYDEHIYHEFLVHPAMAIAPSRKNVLVLGGGDGLAVREILKHEDVESITLVDLDPGMTRLAMENPYLSVLNQGSLKNAKVKFLENNALVDGPMQDVEIPDRTRLFGGELEKVAEVVVVNLDASLFVDQIQGFYDIIVIDFPDPNNLELSKLYSKSFYTKVRSKLSRGGIIVQQSTSPVHSRETFLCIGRTLKEAGFAVMPFHENVPAFGEWGWWLGGRDDFYSTEIIETRLKNIEPFKVPVKYITNELVAASLVFGRNELNTKQELVNTILNNVIYLYYSDALTTSH